jgi:hypothetical protein
MPAKAPRPAHAHLLAVSGPDRPSTVSSSGSRPRPAGAAPCSGGLGHVFPRCEHVEREALHRLEDGERRRLAVRVAGGGRAFPVSEHERRDDQCLVGARLRPPARVHSPSGGRCRCCWWEQAEGDAAFTHAVSQICARRWLGLTATPYRRDQLDDLIALQIGPIRHTVTRATTDTLTSVDAPVPVPVLRLHHTGYTNDGDASPQSPGGMAAIYRDLVADDDRLRQSSRTSWTPASADDTAWCSRSGPATRPAS